jgi:hypothetical protein
MKLSRSRLGTALAVLMTIGAAVSVAAPASADMYRSDAGSGRGYAVSYGVSYQSRDYGDQHHGTRYDHGRDSGWRDYRWQHVRMHDHGFGWNRHSRDHSRYER